MLILDGSNTLKVHKFMAQPHKYVTYSGSMGWNVSYLCRIEVAGFPFPEQCIKSTFYIFYTLLR